MVLGVVSHFLFLIEELIEGDFDGSTAVTQYLDEAWSDMLARLDGNVAKKLEWVLWDIVETSAELVLVQERNSAGSLDFAASSSEQVAAHEDDREAVVQSCTVSDQTAAVLARIRADIAAFRVQAPAAKRPRV